MDESAGASKQDKQPDKSKEDSKDADLKTFRTQCEKACLFELEGRLVPLVAQGSHVEINANVTSTRLYRNLTEAVPLIAFYDVKNAKLCKIFAGEGLTHREPLLDEDDFERFVQTVEPLMQPGRDILWVLAGRTDSNLPKIK